MGIINTEIQAAIYANLCYKVSGRRQWAINPSGYNRNSQDLIAKEVASGLQGVDEVSAEEDRWRMRWIKGHDAKNKI